MKLHPSGLTMDRWNWPFKTASELKIIAIWRNYGLDPNSLEF